MLRDPSGTIKLVLWQQYVNTLIVNTTYVLQNMRLKVYNDERYLNTPKNEEFKPTQVEAFEQPLPEPEHVIDTPSISGKIVGIKDVTTVVLTLLTSQYWKTMQKFKCFMKGNNKLINILRL